MVFWNDKLGPGSFNPCHNRDNLASHVSYEADMKMCVFFTFISFLVFVEFFFSKTARLLVCFILSLVSSFGPWLVPKTLEIALMKTKQPPRSSLKGLHLG